MTDNNPTPLKCIIVDDEELAIEGLMDYVSKIDSLNIVASCSSGIEAFNFLQSNDVNLMFLDINMPQLTGLELLESLENKPLVILTTAYSQYAIEGFRLQVIDYLLKPYSFQRLMQAAEKANNTYYSQLLLKTEHLETIEYTYIKTGNSFQKIKWADILYINAMQNYVKLYFNSSSLIIHQTMTSFEELVPSNIFFRIHNSYLVNVNHIEKVTGNQLLINGIEIPISRHRKEEFMKAVIDSKNSNPKL